MSMLRVQKRLASSVLRFGKKKVSLDPNETNEMANANSHQQIRKMIKDGLIIQKPVTVHSRPDAGKTLCSTEGQAYEHREAEGHCQCKNSREGDLGTKDADPELTSQEIPGIQED
ncbi:60S ribosomal protein L19 [Cricetulus griseus]|uniref:Large ribosomal subunit protein eL19 n=1 Tax=Cricetulus griseus TaxID=10029 RepID=G3IPQ2_CRIGR|nr:60S ribosomal protein L19 [Cricetulus griseus]